VKKLVMLISTAFGIGIKKTPQQNALRPWPDIKEAIIATTCVFNRLKKREYQEQYNLAPIPSDIVLKIIAHAFDQRDTEGLSLQHRIIENLSFVDSNEHDTTLAPLIMHQGLIPDAHRDTLLHKFSLPEYIDRAQFFLQAVSRHAHASQLSPLHQANKNGLTPLDRAIMCQNTKLVTMLLSQLSTSTINTPNRFGNTALHRAAHYNHLSAIESLVQHGATLQRNASGKTPRDRAHRLGYTAIVELLDRMFPLAPAPNTTPYQNQYVKYITTMYSSMLIDLFSNEVPPIVHLDDIQALLECGINYSTVENHARLVSGQKITLIDLVLLNNISMLRLFLDYYPTSYLCNTRSFLETKKWEYIKLFLEYGGDPNALITYQGESVFPLQAYVRWNKLSIVKLLLKHHANTAVLTPNGKTLQELATTADMKKLLNQYLQ
jgi:ankyrin repeat protein